MNRLILSLDPSSTCTGFAILDAVRKTERGFPGLIDCGKLLPKRAKDPANDRIQEMVRELIKLIAEHQPERLIVEDTSGKVGKRARGRGVNGAGLAIHGKAVGWILATCYASGIPTEPILENDWTRGVPKAIRQQIITAAYPLYDPAKDPGGDVSDAIRLGHYAIELQIERRYQEAIARDRGMIKEEAGA